MALLFVLYFRPPDLFALRVRAVVAPPFGGPRILHVRSLLLHPLEEAKGSKTEESDDTILIDNPKFVWNGAVLTEMCACKRSNGPLTLLRYPE